MTGLERNEDPTPIWQPSGAPTTLAPATDTDAPARACMVGFAQVPAEMLTAPLTANALRLWALLDLHQRDNAKAWPSRSHLAEDLGSSADAVDRAVTALEAAGFLAVDRRGGRGRTNRYQLLGRPRDIHNGRSSAAHSGDDDTRNGRTDAAVGRSSRVSKAVRSGRAAGRWPPGSSTVSAGCIGDHFFGGGQLLTSQASVNTLRALSGNWVPGTARFQG
jgi:biotin operon repressor